MNPPSAKLMRRRGAALCSVWSSVKLRRGAGGAAPVTLIRCDFRITLASSNGSLVLTRGSVSVNLDVEAWVLDPSPLKTATPGSSSSPLVVFCRRLVFLLGAGFSGSFSSSACVISGLFRILRMYYG